MMFEFEKVSYYFLYSERAAQEDAFSIKRYCQKEVWVPGGSAMDVGKWKVFTHWTTSPAELDSFREDYPDAELIYECTGGIIRLDGDDNKILPIRERFNTK